MIFTAFYTIGTLYEAEAARLRRSLDKLHLTHDLCGVPDLGSWAANAAYTAAHLNVMLAKHHPAPIGYLDADAVVWQHPILFDILTPKQYDIAAHRAKPGHLNNGTLWLANTPACKAVIQDYYHRVVAHHGEQNEQRHLDKAIKANAECRLCQLPETYCFIHDLMEAASDEAVIEHLQASRECTGSSLLPSRRRRLQELEQA